MTTRVVSIGGVDRALHAEGDEDALAVLRKRAGFKSLLRGCKNQRCGACRVLVNGELFRTCGAALAELPDGAIVEPYEVLAAEATAREAIAAFEASRPSRCHLCVPALAVTSVYLARIGRRRDPVAVDAALEGAACMCTGRKSLRDALLAPPTS